MLPIRGRKLSAKGYYKLLLSRRKIVRDAISIIQSPVPYKSFQKFILWDLFFWIFQEDKLPQKRLMFSSVKKTFKLTDGLLQLLFSGSQVTFDGVQYVFLVLKVSC